MTEALTQVLAMEVTLRGLERVTGGIEKIVEKFHASEEAAKSLKQGLAILSTTFAILGKGIQAAAEDQQLEAVLDGFAGSAENAESQIKLINDIASKGVFGKTNIYDAVTALDEYGVSVKNNIELVEQLAARSKTKDLQSAAEAIGRIASGSLGGAGRIMRQFRIGEGQLKAEGVQFDGHEIASSSQVVLAALTKIVEKQGVLNNLENTLGGAAGRVHYEFTQLLETIGQPFIAPLTAIANKISDMVGWMKDINTYTHGWAGNFIAGGALVVGMAKVWGFIKDIKEWSKDILILQTASQILMSSKFIQTMQELVRIYKDLGIAEAFSFIIQVAMNALVDNWAGIAAALAIAATVGVGLGIASDNAYKNNHKKDKSADAPDAPGNRPIRRDDIERMERMVRGKAWTG